MEAGFELVELAGEAEVEGEGARDRVQGAEGLEDGGPDLGFSCIIHGERTIEVIADNMVEGFPVDHGDGKIVEPEILTQDRAG
jgi:hypothetical protein